MSQDWEKRSPLCPPVVCGLRSLPILLMRVSILFNIAALKGMQSDLTVVFTSVDLFTDELNHLSQVSCPLASSLL